MEDLNAMGLAELFDRLGRDVLRPLLRLARTEDLGGSGGAGLAGDITSRSIIDPASVSEARMTARREGVIAGVPAIELIAEVFEARVHVRRIVPDGVGCAKGQTVAALEGPTLDLLAIERTVLNLVGHLSGIATLTRRYVDAVAATRAVICETRKTTPGLRGLEKYAARCGGATLHRLGLHDALLYKDNHLAGIVVDELGARLTKAITWARARQEIRFVEVEVDSLEQLRAVLAMEPGLVDIVLLDNMAPAMLTEAVAMRDAAAKREGAGGPQLEASGGVTLETVRAIAASGVDRISVGAITHSAPSLDLGLDFAG